MSLKVEAEYLIFRYCFKETNAESILLLFI